jgi:hypothetical protein
VLIGAIAGVVNKVVNKPVRALFDSWFMRAGLVLPLLRRGIHVIAQARIDTALFFPPRSRTGPAWPGLESMANVRARRLSRHCPPSS